jgi:hypothetical protein
MSVNGGAPAHEWAVAADESEQPPPHAQEHGMPAMGGLASAQSQAPVSAAVETMLATMSAQAILDALAAKPKAELGQYTLDIKKIGEKIGKKLVPVWKNEKVPVGCMRCFPCPPFPVLTLPCLPLPVLSLAYLALNLPGATAFMHAATGKDHAGAVSAGTLVISVSIPRTQNLSHRTA